MDNADFNRIYDENYRLVMATARKFIDDDKLCEDVCQEVFIKLLKTTKEMDRNDVRYWLLVVTKTTALDYRKKLKLDKIRMESISEDGKEPATTRDPLHQVLRKEEHQEIMDALREHDPRGMEILIGIEFEGRNVKELAAQYDITPNNLRNRLYRVRKWLKEKFPKEEGYF